MSIGKPKNEPIDLNGLMNEIENGHRITVESDAVDKRIEELRAAQKDLQQTTEALEKATMTLNEAIAALKSITDNSANIVTGINNAIVNAQEKTEYKVSEKPVSVCYVGIQELDRVCGISGKHALVIGSGKTAALAIRYLAEYGADVTVCSRTYQHAKDLLKEFPDIQVIAYDKKTEALKSSDIVVSATSSPHLVIKCAELSGGKKVTLLELLLLTLTG